MITSAPYQRNGIRYYETPLGDFPSVTTILRETRLKKDAEKLRKWQKKMDQVHGTGAAEKTRDEAAKRGTDIHKAIELFMKGELLNPPSSPYFAKALPLLKYLKSEFRGSEIRVWHPSGYAGTLDMIALYEDKPTIFDFTTSHRLKQKEWLKEKFLQCTAYAIAHDYLYESKIESLSVVVLTPEQFQIFSDDLITYEKEWVARVEQFYGLPIATKEQG